MYLGKLFDRTDGNLFIIELPGPDLQRNHTITMLSSVSPVRCYKLNLMAYLYLAESYKATHNYLCAINVLLKGEAMFTRTLPTRRQTGNVSKDHYQTVQTEVEVREPRIKKKSYMVSNLEPDVTKNKFKKHSGIYNQSSIQFNKSEKRIRTESRGTSKEEK